MVVVVVVVVEVVAVVSFVRRAAMVENGDFSGLVRRERAVSGMLLGFAAAAAAACGFEGCPLPVPGQPVVVVWSECAAQCDD